jgi:hypothetical protein
MEQHTNAELRREAEHLFRCLLDTEPPSALAAHYLEVHECLVELQELPVDELRTLRLIVDNRLDAAAVEPWLRRKGRRHALSAKLLLVVYWVECGGSPVGSLRQGARGWRVLVFSTLGGIAGLLRGFYLKVRYGLV